MDTSICQVISRKYFSRNCYCFGSVNPLINCRNGLLKTEGPLYSVYGVKHSIHNSYIRELRNVWTRGINRREVKSLHAKGSAPYTRFVTTFMTLSGRCLQRQGFLHCRCCRLLVGGSAGSMDRSRGNPSCYPVFPSFVEGQTGCQMPDSFYLQWLDRSLDTVADIVVV
jgi:hypothetical protein